MSAQHSVRLVRPGLVLAAGALAMTLAACGGGTSASTAAAPTTTRAPAPSGAGRGNPPAGTFGTAAAVTASNIEVQNPQNGQVTVNFNASTTFTNTVSATLADVTVGGCVTVTAASGGAQAKALTARTVTVTAPASGGTCTGGFGGGGGGGGQPGTTRTPNPSRPRPTGANGAPANFGAAFGSVTAINSTGFTVQGVARGANPAVTTVITVDSTTTYTKTAAATAGALAVGECVTAVGPSDDTGAVTARTINISKPGPNGCTAGLGRFRGGAGGAGGGQGNTGTGTGGGNG